MQTDPYGIYSVPAQRANNLAGSKCLPTSGKTKAPVTRPVVNKPHLQARCSIQKTVCSANQRTFLFTNMYHPALSDGSSSFSPKV